jgi:cell division protein DivIC
MKILRKKVRPAKRIYQKNIISSNSIVTRRRIKKISLLILLVLFILIFITGQRGSYQLYKFSRQVKELEIEIAKISKEIKRLEQEKDKIHNDPAYIEKIAREKYKMKKEGEQVYQIIEE